MGLNRREFFGVAAGATAVLAAGVRPADAAVVRRLGADFAIPIGLGGNSGKVGLAALKGPRGGFAAVFEVDTDEPYTPSYARVYNRFRRPVGPNVPMASTTYAGTDAGAIVANADGTSNVFFFGWSDGDSSRLWWMRRLSGFGKPIGNAVPVGEGWQGDRMFATGLANGTLMAAWQGPGNSHGKVVTVSGAAVGSNDGGLCNGSVRAIASLPEAGAVAAYYGPDLKASFQRLNDRARRVGRPVARPAAFAFGGMTVASHPAGFVGVWKTEDESESPILAGEIFDPTGRSVARLSPLPLRPEGNADLYRSVHPVALSLPDGRVVVAVDSVLRDPVDSYRRHYQILLAVFEPNGESIGEPQVVYSVPARDELHDYLHRPRSLIQMHDGVLLLGFDGGYDFGIRAARALRLRLLV